MTYLIGKHPYLSIKVVLQRNKWKKVECLIDTGFSGGLSLPNEFRDYFQSRDFFEAHLKLADGSEVTVDATFTKVKFENETREIDVIFMGDSEALVGIEFLDQMKFCLDLKEHRVTLE